MPTLSQRIALLIDAENADPRQFKSVMERAAKLGRAVIRRAYGNARALEKWARTVAEHQIVPVLTPPSANKKNASDFALTIDAVGLLHDGRYDHLCIVTSDADFTLLAIHVREQGKHTTGFGEKKALAAFRNALDEFVELGSAEAAKPVVPAPVPKKTKTAAPRAIKEEIDLDQLRSIYDSAAAHARDGVSLQQIGERLSKQGVRYRGHRTLTNYLRKSGLFLVKDNRVTLA